MEFKQFAKSAIWGLISGLYVSIAYVFPLGEIERKPMDIIVYDMSGAKGDFFMSIGMFSLVEYSILMLPSTFFAILIGKQIYQYYCVGSIYFLSRCLSRKKLFFWGEISMASQQFLFQVFLAASVVTIGVLRQKVIVTSVGLLLMMLHIVLQFFWNCLISNIFSILSINKGGNVAFITVMVIYFLSLTSLNLLSIKDLIPQTITYIIIHLNPFAHNILNWQSIPFTTGLKGIRPLEMSIVESVIYYLLLCIVVMIIHYITVMRKDIIMLDMETEMI